jgi:hypothetical protein
MTNEHSLSEILKRFDEEVQKQGIGGLAKIWYKSFLTHEFTAALESLRKEPYDITDDDISHGWQEHYEGMAAADKENNQAINDLLL